MSLLTDIQNNTSSVVNGKLNLAQAITNKGGVLNDYVLVPTFSNLANGINSIETGYAINGGKEVSVLSKGAITKGDICAVEVLNADEYTANTLGSLPTECIDSTGATVSRYGSYRYIALEGGKMVLMPVASGNSRNCYYYPFFWNGSSYEQMTVDGVPNYVYPRLYYILRRVILLKCFL